MDYSEEILDLKERLEFLRRFRKEKMKEIDSKRLTEHSCKERQELCQECLRKIIQGKLLRAKRYNQALTARGLSSKIVH